MDARLPGLTDGGCLIAQCALSAALHCCLLNAVTTKSLT